MIASSRAFIWGSCSGVFQTGELLLPGVSVPPWCETYFTAETRRHGDTEGGGLLCCGLISHYLGRLPQMRRPDHAPEVISSNVIRQIPERAHEKPCALFAAQTSVRRSQKGKDIQESTA